MSKQLNKLAKESLLLLKKRKVVRTKELGDVSSQQNTRVSEIQDFLGCICKTYGRGRKKESFTYYERDDYAQTVIEALTGPQTQETPKPEEKKPYAPKVSWQEMGKRLKQQKPNEEVKKLEERIRKANLWFQLNPKHPKRMQYAQVYGELKAQYYQLTQQQ